MTTRAILRLFHKKIEPRGSTEIETRSLLERQSWSLDEYSVDIEYIVIQYPDSPDAYKHDGRKIAFAPMPWRSFCRWHNGPLFQRDEPWKRLYCVVESDSYCRQHKRSARAIYEYCLSTHSHSALDTCKLIDKMGRTEYVVYLTDAGSGRVKVGVTRRFRFLERISEQAHNLATILYVVDSLYEARRAEIMISRTGLATQVKSRKPHRLSPAQVAPVLAAAAEKAAKLLNIKWNYSFIRVSSSFSNIIFTRPETKIDKLQEQSFDLIGYWGGHVILQNPNGIFHVNDRRIIHRDALLLS